jgi:hypothetical protein
VTCDFVRSPNFLALIIAVVSYFHRVFAGVAAQDLPTGPTLGLANPSRYCPSYLADETFIKESHFEVSYAQKTG